MARIPDPPRRRAQELVRRFPLPKRQRRALREAFDEMIPLPRQITRPMPDFNPHPHAEGNMRPPLRPTPLPAPRPKRRQGQRPSWEGQLDPSLLPGQIPAGYDMSEFAVGPSSGFGGGEFDLSNDIMDALMALIARRGWGNPDHQAV